jgi:hypothetical protein
MKFGTHRVRIGDAFARVGWLRVVYIVDSVVEGLHGMPPHVRLVTEPRSSDAPLLISVSALSDSRFYERVKQPTKAERDGRDVT